jgi:hypothetical protein
MTLLNEFKEAGKAIADLWRSNPSIPNEPSDILRLAKDKAQSVFHPSARILVRKSSPQTNSPKSGTHFK